MSETKVALRQPKLSDGKAVHRLIADNPPLDVNSSYNYFLLCSHFAGTCVVGEVEGKIASFLSAYLIPDHPERLFVWQVAVDSSFRGHGLAGRMLEDVLSRSTCRRVQYVETTISPSNKSSQRVFMHFAERHDVEFNEEVFLTKEHFGEEDHEEEILYRIGPLKN